MWVEDVGKVTYKFEDWGQAFKGFYTFGQTYLCIVTEPWWLSGIIHHNKDQTVLDG